MCLNLHNAGCRAAVAALAGVRWRDIFGGLQAMEAVVLEERRNELEGMRSRAGRR